MTLLHTSSTWWLENWETPLFCGLSFFIWLDPQSDKVVAANSLGRLRIRSPIISLLLHFLVRSSCKTSPDWRGEKLSPTLDERGCMCIQVKGELLTALFVVPYPGIVASKEEWERDCKKTNVHTKGGEEQNWHHGELEQWYGTQTWVVLPESMNGCRSENNGWEDKGQRNKVLMELPV